MNAPASPAHLSVDAFDSRSRRITFRGRPMRFLRTALTLAAVVCTGAPVARAQDAFDSPPPHLSIVEGAATLDREDFSEPATGGAPLVPGDRVRTERGRAEILFPDGSAIDLDEFTSIEFDAPTLMRLTNGRILLSIAGSANPAAALQFQIDTPVASAQTDGPGEYRVSMLGGPSGLQTEMAIVRGAGALVTEAGTMPLRAGERSVAWDNAAPSQPQYFNAARFDAFDQWALGLRDQRLGSRSQSAQYLPADLRIYGGELDRYGSWGYEASYGNVWYPSVGPDWRPYYDGYWSSVPTYGWTWIGVDVWSWPTHHYGRWGYGRNRWFWIPDRRWAPAWVSWGGAPGYVSWCPLGFDNRPVFALSVSIGSRGWGGDNWRGWTVVSRDHFGGRRNVHQFAVSPRSLPSNVGFVAERSAPVAAPRAVPRRGFGGDRQVAGDRRQFPNVVGRSGDGFGNSAVRRGNGDRPAQGPAGRTDDRATINTRSARGVSRQPQTSGQTYQQPQRSDSAGFDNRPRAITRQPQPQSGDRPQTDTRPSDNGQNRGVSRTRPPDVRAMAPIVPTAPAAPTGPNENRGYTARPRYERPSAPQAPAQPIAPRAAPPAERSRYGASTRRAEPIRPVQPPQPESPRPGFSRRGDGPIYTQRPTAPPPAAAPPPQAPQRQERSVQREERAAPPPRQERQSEARSRGRENPQPSPSDRQQNGGGNGNGNGNGNGHHRR